MFQKLREAAAGADVESKINAFLTSDAGEASFFFVQRKCCACAACVPCDAYILCTYSV